MQYSFSLVGKRQVCQVVLPTVMSIFICPHPKSGSFSALISFAKDLLIVMKYQEELSFEYLHILVSVLKVGFGCMHGL